jgi:hypothetical protein
MIDHVEILKHDKKKQLLKKKIEILELESIEQVRLGRNQTSKHESME